MTIHIFYCKFSISYLRNIAKYEVYYKSRVINPQGVHLQHTKDYQLRDPTLRTEFFKIICRLLTYITSGNSRISYLWNYPENAINTVLSFPLTHFILLYLIRFPHSIAVTYNRVVGQSLMCILLIPTIGRKNLFRGMILFILRM